MKIISQIKLKGEASEDINLIEAPSDSFVECPAPLLSLTPPAESGMQASRNGKRGLEVLIEETGMAVKQMKILSGIDFEKYNIPVSVTGNSKPQPITNFSTSGLNSLLIENLAKWGYKVPTPVQKHAIPIILQGRDLIACAQKGSGKTAAFLVPIIHKLITSQADSGAGSQTASPQTLIITPTRELALQIYNEARKFTQGSLIKPAVIYEDTITEQQARKLGEGCNILVASVRALHDCVGQGRVGFTNIDILVLDEADRLFDTRCVGDSVYRIHKWFAHPTPTV